MINWLFPGAGWRAECWCHQDKMGKTHSGLNLNGWLTTQTQNIPNLSPASSGSRDIPGFTSMPFTLHDASMTSCPDLCNSIQHQQGMGTKIPEFRQEMLCWALFTCLRFVPTKVLHCLEYPWPDLSPARWQRWCWSHGWKKSTDSDWRYNKSAEQRTQRS